MYWLKAALPETALSGQASIAFSPVRTPRPKAAWPSYPAQPACSQRRRRARMRFLGALPETPVRATGSMLGHGVEAQFPFNVALAALAARAALSGPTRVRLQPIGDVTQVLVTARGSGAGSGWRWWKRTEHGEQAGYRDAKGRPVVVVTGAGIVTSLGSGKEDNWRKLSGGQSGLHHITRFSTDGLRTTRSQAPSISFRPNPPAHRRFRRIRRGRGRGSDRPGRRSGPNRIFPGRFSWPFLRSSWSGRSAWRWPRKFTAKALDYDDLIRVAGGGKHQQMFTPLPLRQRWRILADRFGTKGSPISLSTACASGATAIQLGVEAIRRGETDAALCIGTDGSVNPESLIRFSLAIRALDRERSAGSRRQTVRQEPRWVRDGGRRRRTGSRKPRSGDRARRENPWRHRGLRRDGGFVPSHALQPGRQADHRLHPERAGRRRT